MRNKIFFALALSVAVVFCSTVRAQDCAPPSLVANANSTNLFTPEQEMIFGELTVQKMAREMRFVRDEALIAYVNSVGGKLAKHLPPTGLRFQFHIVDMPETNAFNIPGGHVFLSRKLVAFVQNEDELAGVMAHELGHAVVRHGAADMSELLRKILGVTALGDRRDIIEKYNLLIERSRTKTLTRPRGHENEQQLEADRAGLYAMIAAGYDPTAFSSFFDRLTESEGKTGGWLSNFFGKTRPEHKRLREMIRVTEKLAPACREGRSAKATEDFLKWQADVVSFREAGRREELPGLLWKKELAPKLRSDVSHFAFSPDGNFLLAQDDFAITVVARESLGVLFQIPIQEANEAAFTPDGQFVVFTTKNLRYEKWSVAERKPVEVRELVMRRDCWEHKLSPDGNYLACVDTSTAINVVETKTGKKVWEKKDFSPMSGYQIFLWLIFNRGDIESAPKFFRIEFSPDSRYVMFSRSDQVNFRFSVYGPVAASPEYKALALDLTTLKPAELGGDLKKIAAHPYVFLNAGEVVGMPSSKVAESGIFAFPSGKRLQQFTLGAREIKRTNNASYVVIKPLSNARMGIFDLKKGIVASGMNKADGTMWNELMAFEATNGKVLLREVKYNETTKIFDSKDVGTIEIPVGSIGNLSAAEVSDNFNWLVMSSKTRGGLWNLETGERKFYVRGFKGGVVGNDGGSVGEFPKMDETGHSLVLMNPLQQQVVPVRPLPERGARQHGRFVLLRSSLTEKKEKEKSASSPSAADDADVSGLGREVRFELKDFIQDKVIWSRDFPKDAPEYSFDEFSGRLILYWRLGSEEGKAKLKESAELQAKANTLGNKMDDYLVEVVDAFAQKTAGMMLLETGQGSFDVGEGISDGDWLVLKDSENRVLVYSIKSGELRHRFFGSVAAVNPKKNQLAVENLPGEVALYDLGSGELLSTFIIKGSAAFVRFNLAGDKFFVLSDAQSAYAFDLNKLAAGKPQAN